MKTISLEWKAFKINGRLVEGELKALVPNKIAGVSENYTYDVHCSDDLTDEEEASIKAHWDSIEETSDAVTSFKSRDEQEADVEQKKASAKAKLLALGLSADEVMAILGV